MNDRAQLITTLAQRATESVTQVRHTRARRAGAGTGIIVGADGLILTNHHVVTGNKALEVVLNDGRAFAATLVRSDAQLDLALLKIDAHGLPALTLAGGEGVRVGAWVFAIGHPWGERNVLTHGIVSAIGQRRAPNGAQSIPYLRSDVRLAPGNSGGPLLDARGDVIGINAMIWGGDLSIAIPSTVARAWLADAVQMKI
jgi:serine protease Do